MSDHPLVRAETVVLVAVGGFAGANARWVLANAVPAPTSVLSDPAGTWLALAGAAPWVAGVDPALIGTLFANVTGAFALGFVLYEAMGSGLLSPASRTALATGFLSSYTTYSTFAVESALAGSPALLAGNVLANYGLGFLAVLLGRASANRIQGWRGA